MDSFVIVIPKSDIPILILAGGKGTRLRELDSTRPKPMVLVNNKPFLFWQLKAFEKQGYRNFILSIGYLAEQFKNYPWNKDFPELKFRFYTEQEPLGTGGAVKVIFNHFQDLTMAWIINGDTYLSQDLPQIDLATKNEITYCTINNSEIFDAKPNLVIEENLVIDADENRGQVFDAGAVFIKRSAVDRYQKKDKCSFHELAKPTMNIRKVGFFELNGACFDIGTPERYKRFEKYLKEKK
jgi:D-glycero-alpha-D-manno-heptose 1-phosphate guanylyltransferase